MPGYLALVAEATSALSGAVIISCLLLVTFLILRYQHGDHSSVVRMQHQPVQVAVQKLFIPYTLQLSTRFRGDLVESDERLSVRVRCGASGRGCLVRWWWGVRRQALASLLHSQWQDFRTSVVDDIAFPNVRSQSKLLEEGDHELELRASEVLRLGPLPRDRYPLVVVQLDTERQHCDSQLGSVVTVLHVPDSECPEPSRVLYQYLKQFTGQLTMLTTLYTQSNGVNSTASSTPHGSEEDTEKSSDTNVPAESTASARDSDHSEVSSCESVQHQTDTVKFKSPQSVFAVDNLEGKFRETRVTQKTQLHNENRVTEVNDSIHENRGGTNNVGVTRDCSLTENSPDLDGPTVESSESYTPNLEGTTDRTAECGLYSSDVAAVCLKKRSAVRTSDNETVASSSSSYSFPHSCLSSPPQKEFDINDRLKTSLISSVELVTSVSHLTRMLDEPSASSTSSNISVDDPLQSCSSLNSGQRTLKVDLNRAVESPSKSEEIVSGVTTEAKDAATVARAESLSGVAALPSSDASVETASVVATESPWNAPAKPPPCSEAEPPSCAAAKLPSCVAAELPSCVAAERTSDAAAELSSDAAAELASNVSAELASDAASELVSNAAAELTSGAAAELPSYATAELASATEAEPTSNAAVDPPSGAAAEQSSGAAAKKSSDTATEKPADFEAEQPADECVVCQIEQVAVALLPCCHVCVCFSCFHHLMAQSQTCPLCRQHVSAYFVV